MTELLTKKNVEITISEPWDISGEVFEGEVKGENNLDGDDEKILIKLKEPFLYENMSYEYFVGSPRHSGDSLKSLLKNETIVCHIVKTNADDGLNLSNTDSKKEPRKGTFFFIAGIKLSD